MHSRHASPLPCPDRACSAQSASASHLSTSSPMPAAMSHHICGQCVVYWTAVARVATHQTYSAGRDSHLDRSGVSATLCLAAGSRTLLVSAPAPAPAADSAPAPQTATSALAAPVSAPSSTAAAPEVTAGAALTLAPLRLLVTLLRCLL